MIFEMVVRLSIVSNAWKRGAGFAYFLSKPILHRLFADLIFSPVGNDCREIGNSISGNV